jgi:hypothetical protein
MSARPAPLRHWRRAELYLGRPEAFQDLFDLMQPRACLENLLCAYVTPSGLDLTA